MRFEVVKLIATKAAGPFLKGELLQVGTNPRVALGMDQIGIIISSHRFNDDGVVCLGGIVHPGWQGSLTVELMSRGDLSVEKGDKVAHLVIFTEEPAPGRPGEWRVG